MNISDCVTAVLEEISEVLAELTDEQFSIKMAVLSGASLGEPVRHVLEFFQ